MRYAAIIQYQGQNYFGWQIQPNNPSIQATVELALSKVANHPIKIYCAGRTDRGVHAIQQVVHFNSNADRTLRNWLLGTNTNLPGDISILSISEVADNFNARFSATARRYLYFIDNNSARRSLYYRRSCQVSNKLHLDAMIAASKYLIGTQDFSSFRSSGCQAKSPIKTIEDCTITKFDGLIKIRIKADSFLYNMVRNIVSVVINAGLGRINPQQMQAIIAAKQRRAAGSTATPYGLYFEQAYYPKHFNLPIEDKDIWI